MTTRGRARCSHRAPNGIYVRSGRSEALWLRRAGVHMPLDSTQIRLEQQEQLRFSRSSALTDQLTLLFHEWSGKERGGRRHFLIRWR